MNAKSMSPNYACKRTESKMRYLLTSANRFTLPTFGKRIETLVLSSMSLTTAFLSVYEDRELQAAEKRAQERLEFENQIIKIQTMLEFERSRDTAGHAEEIRNEVTALEDALQKCQKNEKKYRKVRALHRQRELTRAFLPCSFRLSKTFNKKSATSKITC